MKKHLSLALWVIPVSAWLSGCAGVHGPKDTIVFSHHIHTEQGLGCADCHGDLPTLEAQGAALVPGKPKCAECHDVESKDSCATCHRNPNAPSTWSLPRGSASFSHASHEDKATDCASCHLGADHWPDRSLKAPTKPGHGECQSCHKNDIEHGKCSLCHDRLEMGALSKAKHWHEDGFANRHGYKAQGQESQCASCHDQSYCAQCHSKTTTVRPSLRFPEAVDRQLIHRGDYLTRHALEARVGTSSCLKCHGTQSCQTCHERSGVGAIVGRQSPHPPGWAAAIGRSGHGIEARRNIARCASCHDQGPRSRCIDCHATAAKGGHTSRNPHPPGWTPPVPEASRASHAMCSICH
jgi:hypothetical protein